MEEAKVKPTWFQRIVKGALKYGPIPRHVAFIMDGNRRFAKKKHVERIEGHSKGFDKLAQTLWWCEDLGVEIVTVYAFSAENFKRSQDEVDSLMELARSRFQKIKEEKEKLAEHGVKIRIVGEIHLLPADVQKLAGQLEIMTADNTKCCLNICVAYTSRLEMTSAVRKTAWGVQQGLLEPEDINEHLINASLDVPEVDLLIRTSGEIRLSDFLLWQSSFSYLSFIKPLWPEFSVWDFYGVILQYQRNYNQIKKCKDISHLLLDESKFNDTEASTTSCISSNEQRVKDYLTALKERRSAYYKELACD